MSWLKQFLSILEIVASAVERWRRERERLKHLREVDDVRKSPGDWFDRHFNGGVRNVPKDAGNAGKAADAGPDSDGKRRD